MERYPIRFVPQERKALWGREMWLVSAHPSQPSVVANGAYAGRTLPDLFAEFGAELAGARAGAAFPLLVKIIEADDRLSLQVHPNECTAKQCGGDPKTEMWYVLGGKPGAGIMAGLRAGIGREELVRMLHGGQAEDAVMRFAANRGDVLFIPGGLVHAIGAGCRLYEVQQTSDTTWRLHDWDRVDPATGKPRTTNEEEGLLSIDWSLPPPQVMQSGKSGNPLVDCPYFRFSAMDLSRAVPMECEPDRARMLFAGEGSCEVLVEGHSAVALDGKSCVLLPPGTPCTLVPDASCRILVAED